MKRIPDTDDPKTVTGGDAGQTLVDAMRQSPIQEIDLEPAGEAMPVRDVDRFD
jgi:hypothetical protein